jgi:hypothetical protein
MQNEHRMLCGTKASRSRMAQQVRDLALRYGWQVNTQCGKRQIAINLCNGAYRVSLCFDGDSKVGAFFAHWHIDCESDIKPYTVSFAAAIRGSRVT